MAYHQRLSCQGYSVDHGYALCLASLPVLLHSCHLDSYSAAGYRRWEVSGIRLGDRPDRLTRMRLNAFAKRSVRLGDERWGIKVVKYISNLPCWGSFSSGKAGIISCQSTNSDRRMTLKQRTATIRDILRKKLLPLITEYDISIAGYTLFYVWMYFLYIALFNLLNARLYKTNK